MWHPPRLSLVFCLLAPGLVPQAHAAEPIVWRTDYAAARKEAIEKNLPMLVVVGTTDCFYCKKMDASTYADPEIVKQISGQFIPLKLDANREVEFARAMKVTLYPTTILASTDGRVVGYLQGYVAPTQFRDSTEKALAMLKPADTALASRPKPLPTAAPVGLSKPVVGAAADATRPVIPQVIVPQQQTAPTLLLAAQQAYEAERYGECLDRCELLIANHQRTPQAEDAFKLVARIKSDPDRLAAAEMQLDDRIAATYISLGDTWNEKGRTREAVSCYEKALKLQPAGKLADQTRVKIAELRRDSPTIGIGADRN